MFNSFNLINKVSKWKQKGEKMTKQNETVTLNKVTPQISNLEKVMKTQSKLEKMDNDLKKYELSESDVKKNMPVINVMNTSLMTNEIVVKDYNMASQKPNEVIAVKRHNVQNFVKQITSNIVIGAKAIFLVCRDLALAEKHLPKNDFELLCKELPLSESTISKYKKIGQDTTVRELFQLNRLPESWTTMYKIAKVKFANDAERNKLIDFVDTKTTSEDINTFLYGVKKTLGSLWAYDELDNPQDFIKVAYDKKTVADPIALEELKNKIDIVVKKTIEDFNNSSKGYSLLEKKDKRSEDMKVGIATNNTLFENLYKHAEDMFKKIKAKDVRDKVETAFNLKRKKASGEVILG